MVESLKELNAICQKPHYKKVGNWMVRYILRDAALPITWLLLHTPVTANQVTLISILIGMAGLFLLAVPSAAAFLTGALLLQLWYLLDHVDGQIARYRKTASLSGRFFDFLMHHLIHAPILFALGFYAFEITGSVVFILLGFMASLAIIFLNLLNDIRCKTFFEALISKESFDVVKQEEASNGPAQARPLLQKLISWVHKGAEIHVMMNVLTAIGLLNIWLKVPHPDFRFCAFLFYALTIPVLTVAKYTHWIKIHKVDTDFQRFFKTRP